MSMGTISSWCGLCTIMVGAALAWSPASPGSAPHTIAREPRPLFCYIPNPTDEQLNEIAESTGGLNPAVADRDDRFALHDSAWTGQSQLGDTALAQPAELTYSFPNGLAPWGDPCCFQEPNQLDDLLVQMFGFGNLDLGREYLRQAMASWTSVAGLSLREVDDDDAPLDISPAASLMRGDIRIGANTQQSCSRRAAAFLPLGGGDIFFNAGAFFPIQCLNGLGLPDLDFLNLRNVAAHEFGHSLGFFHSTPCDGTKLLEPSVDTDFEFIQIDELRGAHRNYGDRFAPNQSALTAHDFGNLTTPIGRAVVEPDLSTNGLSGALNTDEDWFRFTISAARELTIRATPTGGAYPAAQQTIFCEPAFPSIVDAQVAGDLILELWTGDGTSLLTFTAAADPGSPETLVVMLDAGSYLVRVLDLGPNAAQNQIVQLYDLEIRAAGVVAPPRAIAGLDKRVSTGRTCFFIGDLLSRALEPGATLNPASFDWDLDGDQIFETLDDPRPMTIYESPGIVPVTLRVTDSNAMVALHTIDVTITDPPAIPPAPFDLLTPVDNAQLAVAWPTLDWQSAVGADTYTLTIEVDLDDDGTFESVWFTQSDLMASSFSVSQGMLNYKLSYRWSVEAHNDFGTTASSAMASFRTPTCDGDGNYDKTVDFSDVNVVLQHWLATYLPGRSGLGDSDNSEVVDFADVNEVLNHWIESCP